MVSGESRVMIVIEKCREDSIHQPHGRGIAEV